MKLRVHACLVLLFLLPACATTAPAPRGAGARTQRIANLQRAAALPWKDEGRCIVREASHAWPMVVERCFHALDHEKIRFRDPTGKCAIASAGAAAMGIGVCALVAPEIIVGAVIITGVVVVTAAIQDELDSPTSKGVHPGKTEPGLQAKPAPHALLANKRRPQSEPSGQGWPPLTPPGPTRARAPDCTPRPVPHLGGDALHNTCADRVPQNAFPGSDVLVNGKNFDALQLRARVLWEVKTDNFATYTADLQDIVIDKQAVELKRERELARACGFDFRVGVRSPLHQSALLEVEPDLDIVVMDWC
ncbi:hypothetical protein SAMN05443639_101928 [Stigmatella erecta]|uniref:DUF6310 domain-containing protein n=2 Tax=Stigmatella erecta TaxID=83460 RepID=A0A1I0B6H0_9BACT|nr:DUF6310 domain-containing protein [Stigmatella erecta]SET02324.1 hypothetical protein SAMN05443639_101928 [Stigmatella erecta]